MLLLQMYYTSMKRKRCSFWLCLMFSRSPFPPIPETPLVALRARRPRQVSLCWHKHFMQVAHCLKCPLLGVYFTRLCPRVSRYPMAMGTLADLEDQEPIPGKENPIKIHLQVGRLQWQGSLLARLSKPRLNSSYYPLQYVILTLFREERVTACLHTSLLQMFQAIYCCSFWELRNVFFVLFFLGCNAACQFVLSRHSQRFYEY